MKMDAHDLIAAVGGCMFTAGLYLLWGAPVALLVDGALLTGLSLFALRA